MSVSEFFKYSMMLREQDRKEREEKEERRLAEMKEERLERAQEDKMFRNLFMMAMMKDSGGGTSSISTTTNQTNSNANESNANESNANEDTCLDSHVINFETELATLTEPSLGDSNLEGGDES